MGACLSIVIMLIASCCTLLARTTTEEGPIMPSRRRGRCMAYHRVAYIHKVLCRLVVAGQR